MNKIKLDKLVIKGMIHLIKSKPSLYKHFNFSYKTQKYRLEDVLLFIIDILKYGFSWRYIYKLDKTKFKTNFKHISNKQEKPITNIHWSTIYKVFKKLNYYNIFKNTYIELLNKYVKKSPKKNLTSILSDTSTIYNKYNIDIAKRNAYFKNKRVIKISANTLKSGIPLNIQIYSGNKNDINILDKQLDDGFYVDYQLNNNVKIYFLADKGYDSKKLKDKIKRKGYIPIIDYNIRNTKDSNKIKELTKEEKEIYKNRIRVENLFAKLKMHYNRLNLVNEKKIVNYESFLFLALCFIISKEM